MNELYEATITCRDCKRFDGMVDERIGYLWGVH